MIVGIQLIYAVIYFVLVSNLRHNSSRLTAFFFEGADSSGRSLEEANFFIACEKSAIPKGYKLTAKFTAAEAGTHLTT